MIDISQSASYIGDCRDLLAQLPERCIQTCVTSPPYWGLRDYGVEGQLGLEQSPHEYVANMVEVFRGVRRALRDDGTLWLNLGDSYAGSWGNQGRKKTRGTQRPINGPMMQRLGTRQHRVGCDLDGDCSCGIEGIYPERKNTGSLYRTPGCKNKDLVGIPWMVAFALREDGWYLRSDIIWAKPNPMPESVTDRPTKAHEYVFLLSKSRRYFYDHRAVQEPEAPGSAALKKYDKHWTERPGNGEGNCDGAPWRMGGGYDGKRNKRTVWTIATQPYAGSHFATMPPALAETCILAGSKPGDIVLDPFFGSGTTGMVAEKHGRKWIGFDLNPEYKRLQDERTAQRSLVLP